MSPFGPLEKLRARPIPDQAEARLRRIEFRNKIPIDKSAVEFAEPLIEVGGLGIAGENYYAAEHNPPYWRRIDGATRQLLLRHRVAHKLVNVNKILYSVGLELFVFDAWRPRAVQAYFHDVWMPSELKRRSPALAGEALDAEVERYWAAPTCDPDRPAPHATGAAVDLTLRFIGGEKLWMGSLFDDVSELSHRDRFEEGCAGLSFSDEEARANRRLLHWIMEEHGLAGHPDEWWHYSYGDQLWAALASAPAALYGLAQVPISK